MNYQIFGIIFLLSLFLLIYKNRELFKNPCREPCYCKYTNNGWKSTMLKDGDDIKKCHLSCEKYCSNTHNCKISDNKNIYNYRYNTNDGKTYWDITLK